MSPPTRGPQERRWAGVAAAVNAAARELPSRLMHLDPRLEDLQCGEASPGSEASHSGLVLEGDWSAPARAREATSSACTRAGLHPAVAAPASVVALRAVTSAVAAGAGTVTVKVTASPHGVYASLRAGFAVPAGLDGQKGSAAVRASPWVVDATAGSGGSGGRGGTGRDEQGGARLFGVAVDACGVLQDRADVIVWFEMCRTAAAAAPEPVEEPGAVL